MGRKKKAVEVQEAPVAPAKKHWSDGLNEIQEHAKGLKAAKSGKVLGRPQNYNSYYLNGFVEGLFSVK